MSGPAIIWMLCAAIAAPSKHPDVTRGEAAYREGRWDEASAAFAAAHESTGDPTYLYTQAQAERRAGRCEVAIELYDRFLASDPPAQAAGAARGFQAECRAAPRDAPASAPETEAATTSPGPVPPPRVSPPDAPRSAAPRWWNDPVGGVLVSIGGAALVAGATMVGLAPRELRRSRMLSDEAGRDERIDRAKTFQIVGATVLATGVALAIGGVVRWVLIARRGRRAAPGPTVAATLGGVQIRGLPQFRWR